jgi:hypothetical protein
LIGLLVLIEKCVFLGVIYVLGVLSQSLVVATKEIGLEVNANKSKDMIMS